MTMIIIILHGEYADGDGEANAEDQHSKSIQQIYYRDLCAHHDVNDPSEAEAEALDTSQS